MHLTQETAVISTESEITNINDRLLHRFRAAQLAYTMFKIYDERKMSIPDAIKKWQDICADPEEFCEVRNAWDGDDDGIKKEHK